jgi:hypothetical protein
MRAAGPDNAGMGRGTDRRGGTEGTAEDGGAGFAGPRERQPGGRFAATDETGGAGWNSFPARGRHSGTPR